MCVCPHQIKQTCGQTRKVTQVYTCVCLYIYIERERERERESFYTHSHIWSRVPQGAEARTRPVLPLHLHRRLGEKRVSVSPEVSRLGNDFPVASPCISVTASQPQTPQISEVCTRLLIYACMYLCICM